MGSNVAVSVFARALCRAHCVIGLIITCSVLDSTDTAQATGFFIDQQSASGLGRANAGDAAAALDASTVYFNPAGMTELWRNADTSQDTLLQLGGHIIIPQSHLGNNQSTATTLGTGNVALSYLGSDANNPGHVAPNYKQLCRQRLFDGAAYVGLGITTPFGLSGEYESSWFGRYDNIKSALLTIDIGPVVAIPIKSMHLDWRRGRHSVSVVGPVVRNPKSIYARWTDHCDRRTL